jgi:hypothetical protein
MERDREPDPIEQLEAALADVSSDVGGEVSFDLSEERRRAAGRIADLVADQGFAYTVNANGDVIVPVGDGSTDLYIRSLELDGEPFLSISMAVLAEVRSGRAVKRLPEALAEVNAGYPGVKFCAFPQHGTVFAYVDLPADGLETPTLLAAMRRLVRVVALSRAPLTQRLGAGRPLPGVAQVHKWTLEDTFSPDERPG